MQINEPHLTLTGKRGVYGYRRGVPAKYRHLFGGRREVVKSLKTKSLTEALILRDREDRAFEAIIETAGLTQFPEAWTQRQKYDLAEHYLKDQGVLPEQLPRINTINPSPDELAYMEFVALHKRYEAADAAFVQSSYPEVKYWAERGVRVNLKDQSWMSERVKSLKEDVDKLMDQLLALPRNRIIEDYVRYVEAVDDSVGGIPADWPLAVKQTEGQKIASSILRDGTGNVAERATWRFAIEEYITSDQTIRNKAQAASWKRNTWTACERLAGSAFVFGMDTKLTDIKRPNVEDAVVHLWPHPPTRKRNARIFQAVINRWNQRYPDYPVTNPFLKLVSDKQIRNSQVKVRSFNKDEWVEIHARVDAIANSETRLIAQLAMYAGIPSGEAAGIERGDLILTHNNPHLIIQNNEFRVLGKDRFPRAIPLVGQMLESVLKFLQEKDFSNEYRLFPSYFRADGRMKNDDLSDHLNPLVVNQARHDRRKVRWYSTRHTFKDICVAAGITESHRRYLMGHSDKQGGSHDSYGTAPPTQLLRDDMVKVTSWRGLSWGDHDRSQQLL